VPVTGPILAWGFGRVQRPAERGSTNLPSLKQGLNSTKVAGSHISRVIAELFRLTPQSITGLQAANGEYTQESADVEVKLVKSGVPSKCCGNGR
jgi:hypothetical protein